MDGCGERSGFRTERGSPFVSGGLWSPCGADAAEASAPLGASAAETAAARAALGLPETPGAARAIAVESLRDHACKLGLVWPARLGFAPEPAMTAALSLAALDGGRALALRLFGDAPAPRRLPAFERWLRNGETPAARLFAHAWRRWDSRLGRLAIRPLGPWALSGDIDFANASVDGAPVDASLAARAFDDDLMREIEARRGRGVVWRMAARLVDLERLLDRLAAPEAGDHPLSPRPGLGWVEGADGATLVRAASFEGRLLGLERLTPLDFARHPAGSGLTLLAALPAAVDPAFRFIALDSASAAGPRSPRPSGFVADGPPIDSLDSARPRSRRSH